MNKKLLLAILIVLFVISLTFIIRNTGKDTISGGASIQDNVQAQVQEQNNYVGDYDDDDEYEYEDDFNDVGAGDNVNTTGTSVTPSSSSTGGVVSSELSKHNSQGDCWIAYGGKVYDITSFLPKHPGGINRILPYCGTADEFQNAFAKKHGTSQVNRLMQVGAFMGDFDVVGNLG